MEVYILRHAIAAPRGTPGIKEAERPLTNIGKKKMERAARGIAQIVPGVDVILTSPFKRAYDTAVIAAKEMNCSNKLTVFEPLESDTPYKTLIKALAKYNKKNAIMLVGHEPDLSYFASALIGMKNSTLELKKGSLCRIDIDGFPPRSAGVLKWLIKPNQLRLMGKK